jgi:hypothetical protein
VDEETIVALEGEAVDSSAEEHEADS